MDLDICVRGKNLVCFPVGLSRFYFFVRGGQTL